jgi:hypothetical protein
LKALQSNAFKNFFCLGLSAKPCNYAVLLIHESAATLL